MKARFRSPTVALSFVAAAFLFSCPLWGDDSILPGGKGLFTATGSISVIPVDTWGSGDFAALADTWSNLVTPRTNQMSLTLKQTATTTYEGDLAARDLGLSLGLNINVDNNVVGKLYQIMGYVGYKAFTLRVQSSQLEGQFDWKGYVVPGSKMAPTTNFNNSFLSIDLLYYWDPSAMNYIGFGYTSYQLPVQLDCLVYSNLRQEVWWAPVSSLYQPDMAFHIYSFLFGMDTMHDQKADGLGFWAAAQDRFGGGMADLSSEAQSWVEEANKLPIWSSEQIAMMVDYDMTLGGFWVGNTQGIRWGVGLGFNLGGQVVLCISPKGTVDSTHVDASPSVYLYHYGPVLRGSLAW